MIAYVIRRVMLIIPTLLGIMLVNFIVVQFAPGGPVEQVIARIRGDAVEATARIGGAGGGDLVGRQDIASIQGTGGGASGYRGAQGLDPAFIRELEVRFGFDRPPAERFLRMIGQFLTLDFGRSYFRDRPVIDLVLEKLPVSISLGLWTTLIIYLVSIPLGIAKAMRNGSTFDARTSLVIAIGHAVPSFLFAVLLIVVFAGGRLLSWFPLRGLTSDNAALLPWYQQVVDYLWHITLPVTAMVVGGFATLTMLTKNSFLEELSKQYVTTARAKGLSKNKVLYGHIFRNAMILVIAGFPEALISVLFSGSVLIEVIFSLDGLGLLGFEAVVNRDYPIIFATLFVFSLIGLVLNLISDLIKVMIDPRIDYGSRRL